MVLSKTDHAHPAFLPNYTSERPLYWELQNGIWDAHLGGGSQGSADCSSTLALLRQLGAELRGFDRALEKSWNHLSGVKILHSDLPSCFRVKLVAALNRFEAG